MKKSTLLMTAVGLIAIIVISSFAINVYVNKTKVNGTTKTPEPQSSTLWTYSPISEYPTTTLAVDNDKVFTMGDYGNVNCFNSTTGKSLWNSSINNDFASGMVISDGKIYCGAQTASVSCLNETTGKYEWAFTSGSFGVSYYDKQAPSKIVAQNGQVYDILNSPIGVGVTDANATTGAIIWQAFPSLSASSFGSITSPTWQISGRALWGNPFDGETFYAIGGNQSSSYIFQLSNSGVVSWKSSLNMSVVGEFPSVLALYPGQVVLKYGNEIFSLNRTTGKQLWALNFTGPLYEPAVYSNLLLFGSSDGNLYAVNMINGAFAWKTKVDSQNLFSFANETNTPIMAPIQVDAQNKIAYWSFGVNLLKTNTLVYNPNNTFTGALVGLNVANGTLLWAKQINESATGGIGLAFNQNMVVLTVNNGLWIFNASNGNLIKYDSFGNDGNGFVLPQPGLLNNTIFIVVDQAASTQQQLWAINVNTAGS